MTATAWFCPACQRHHAPHLETCPAPVDAVGTRTLPGLPDTTPLSPQFYPTVVPSTPRYTTADPDLAWPPVKTFISCNT